MAGGTRCVGAGPSCQIAARERAGATAAMAQRDFDLRGLYEALDERRRERHLSWAAVAAEVNRFRTTGRPISVSTMTGLGRRAVAEGDGILQMLVWLGRT